MSFPSDAGIPDAFRWVHALCWTAIGTVATGLALRNCVLIAAGTLVALQAFHLHMDANAPWQGWRAAVRCLVAGLLALAAAGGLLAMVALAWIGWWRPETDNPLIGVAALALAALVCSAAAPPGRGIRPSVSMPFAMLAGGTALLASSRGWPVALCAYAAAAAVVVGFIGWMLVRSVASELVSADGRH